MDLLLADDSPAIQKVMSLSLGGSTYRVSMVSTLVEMKKQLAHSDYSYSLLICDGNLPGLAAPEELAVATHDYPNLKVLILRGSYDPFDEKSFSRAGFSQVLSKPFSVQQILSWVNTLAPLPELRTEPELGASSLSDQPTQSTPGASSHLQGSQIQQPSYSSPVAPPPSSDASYTASSQLSFDPSTEARRAGAVPCAPADLPDLPRPGGAADSSSYSGGSATAGVVESLRGTQAYSASSNDSPAHLSSSHSAPSSNPGAYSGRRRSSSSDTSGLYEASIGGSERQGMNASAPLEAYRGAWDVVEGRSSASPRAHDLSGARTVPADIHTETSSMTASTGATATPSNAVQRPRHLSSLELDLVVAEVWSRLQKGLQHEIDEALERLVQKGLDRELRDVIRAELRTLVDERARL